MKYRHYILGLPVLKMQIKEVAREKYCKIERNSVTKIQLFLYYSELLYLLIIGVEGYCCA